MVQGLYALRLMGTDEKRVYESFTELLDDPSAYESMSKASNPYGDGFASKRIAEILIGTKSDT